jgi:hypothetical protein
MGGRLLKRWLALPEKTVQSQVVAKKFKTK